MSSPPLECFRTILCAGALCDKQTNLLTYINVHEAMVLPDAQFGEYIAAPAHFAIRGHGSYEIRPAWVARDGRSIPAGDQPDTVTLDGMQRFCAPVVRCPPEPGEYDLVLEWRHTTLGAKWQRGAACNPIVLRRQDAPPKKLDS